MKERSWCWERLRTEREGGNREWNDWMASVTQWTWVWANPRRQRRTGKHAVLQSMGSQRVGHDLVTEQQRRWRRKTIYKINMHLFQTPQICNKKRNLFNIILKRNYFYSKICFLDKFSIFFIPQCQFCLPEFSPLDFHIH